MKYMGLTIDVEFIDSYCNYESPKIEMIEVNVEKGFSSSQSGNNIEDLEQEKW